MNSLRSAWTPSLPCLLNLVRRRGKTLKDWPNRDPVASYTFSVGPVQHIGQIKIK